MRRTGVTLFLTFISIFLIFFLQSCGFIPQKLCAPSDLEVVDVSPDSVKIQWHDNTISEDGFEIFRSEGGDFHRIGTVGMNTESFEDTAVLPSRRYAYKVRAFKGNTVSEFSEAVEVTTLEAYPNPPGNLRDVDKSESYVRLSWIDRSNNEKGFRVFRSLDGENYIMLYELPENSTTFEDRNLSPGTTYHYYIEAFNDSGSSGRSNILVVRTNNINDPPTDLRPVFPPNGSVNQNFYSITLRWEARDPNNDSLIYTLYFGTDPIPPVRIRGMSITQFTVNGLSPDTTYYWKIAVYDKHGNTVYGPVWTFRTKSNRPPLPPSNLRASAVSESEIDLRWDDNSDNETGFEISRSFVSWTGYSKIGEVESNVTMFRDEELTAGRHYCYKVRSKNEFGYSVWVGPVCVSTGGDDP